MAARLTKKRMLEIGRSIMDAMGDVLYEPWEWGDMESLPAGHEWWSDEARQAWLDRIAIRAAEAALEELPGAKEWKPGGRR